MKRLVNKTRLTQFKALFDFVLIICAKWLTKGSPDMVDFAKLIIYKGHPEVRFCDFKRPRQEYLAYFFADLVVFYIIPLLLSCVLYILIARVLFARRRRFRQPNSTNGASTSGCVQISFSSPSTSSFKAPPMYIDSTANANHARAQELINSNFAVFLFGF
ncbi:hypothetical protein J437_LFUL000645 [Ladona fulva]|uniref:Thyroliberin receptor n=1 Tax=Ladona fulva TaxID=123851 RepID=A0A8K0K3B4_LADFU|nr:hypothetical protein J437_LFUL000645 [Ladona fulva]